MAVFEMITNPPAHLIQQADAISEAHFTIDTADMDVVHEWLVFNPYIITYAVLDGVVRGFFNVMPLTQEAGKLFEREEIQEEDLRIEHILPNNMQQFAKYAYIAAIAVDEPRNYIDRQCAAALVSCLCDLLRNHYNRATPVTLFANSTTFEGNRIVNKLGMQPISNNPKSLKQSSIHKCVLDGNGLNDMAALSMKYKRFIGANPWDKATS